jgi:sigma-B regulation protein RsbU (phosphoserine phosphatase)
MEDLLRALTPGNTLRGSLGAFMAKYRRVRQVDYFVGVVSDAEESGAYRVLYALGPEVLDNAERHLPDDVARPRQDADPRKRFAGGFIAEVTRSPGPKLAFEFDLRDDPALAFIPPHMRTCMVLPIVEGDRVVQWSLGFNSVPEERYTPKDVSHAWLVANLMGLSNRGLDALEKVRQLNQTLRDQFDGVARVQQSLLPAQLPRIRSMELSSSYLTSDMAGGDYYRFFPLVDPDALDTPAKLQDVMARGADRWGFIIADVSGHGAAAATVTAMLHATLVAYGSFAIRLGGSSLAPSTVAEFVNSQMISAGLEASFVTAFFGLYDARTGELTYCNCGHNPPRLWRRRDSSIDQLDEHATFPLGIAQPLAGADASIRIDPGDVLLLYTDGIVEAFNHSREMFGVDRLDAALREACERRTGGADAVLESVFEALFRHRKAYTRDDDQTLVVMRRTGP